MSDGNPSSRSGAAIPKYAIPEIERRWLVDVAAVRDLSEQPSTVIEDLYVECSRLRLRKMYLAGGKVIYKLCRKYGKTSEWSEPITNLYLKESEYRLLDGLPGDRIRKRRYPVCGGSLDVFEHPHSGLMIFEREFESEAEAAGYAPPDFVTREIGRGDGYTGAELAMSGSG